MKYPIIFYRAFLLCSMLLSGCKSKEKDSTIGFELLPRNSYFVDSYNGIGIYRLNSTKAVMDGYYVIGNKISKWEEFEVKEGILNGDYMVFHSNGEIFSHAQYKNGKLHGEEKFYSPSGKLKTVKTYSNGILYGKTLSYFENGQLQSESKIKDEEVIESVSYNSLGGIIGQMFFKDGLKITQTITGGKISSEMISSTYDNFEAMKFYNEDGSLKMYLRMLEEEDKSYIIELDENGNETKRIDVKTEPQELMNYIQYLNHF